MSHHIGTLLILGAGGDLSKRLLLPGIGGLVHSGRFPELRIVGVGQQPMADEEWRQLASKSLAAGGADDAQVDALVARSRYVQADVTDRAAWEGILAACTGIPAIYFALPPAVTERACAALESVPLPEGTVLALEKPFGRNVESAQALNRQLVQLVPEVRVHRVDHFLGKSMVLNLLGLRFANRMFEQVWNRDNIERVEIVYDETLALEGRAGYYDSAGALVDMVQSHLLLVMALVVMEPPSSIEPEDLRGGMTQALRAATIGNPIAGSRRARYTAGTVGDRAIPSYADEAGVDAERGTETLTELTVSVQNWRWSGVPFTLRSGKALGAPREEIVLYFRDVPHLPTGFTGRGTPAKLRIGLRSDHIALDLTMNGAGDPFELDPVTLQVNLGAGDLSAYGEVLAGILSADPTLSVRGDQAEECWRILAPVLEAWRLGVVPLEEYPAGSAGPTGWASGTAE